MRVWRKRQKQAVVSVWLHPQPGLGADTVQGEGECRHKHAAWWRRDVNTDPGLCSYHTCTRGAGARADTGPSRPVAADSPAAVMIHLSAGEKQATHSGLSPLVTQAARTNHRRSYCTPGS